MFFKEELNGLYDYIKYAYSILYIHMNIYFFYVSIYQRKKNTLSNLFLFWHCIAFCVYFFSFTLIVDLVFLFLVL